MATAPFCRPSTAKATRRHPLRATPDPLGLELHQPEHDLWATILPNPSNPAVPYKVQYFASFGLAGHQAHPTPATALAAALRDGFTEPDPGALHRLSQTPAWQAAYGTSAAPPAPATALQRVLQALVVLHCQAVTVDAVTFHRGRVPPPPNSHQRPAAGAPVALLRLGLRWPGPLPPLRRATGRLPGGARGARGSQPSTPSEISPCQCRPG